MKPMLAHKYAPKRISLPCWQQPKLNGVRALYQDGRFYSRDEIQWAEPVLEHLARELRELVNPKYYPLDGELYVHGWSLQKINSAVSINQRGPGDQTSLVEYHIFDVVNFKHSFLDRFLPIHNLLRTNYVSSKLRAVSVREIDSLSAGDSNYNEYISSGYEGCMYRPSPCMYTKPKVGADQDNRTFNLLKRKDWQTDEFLIVSLTEGRDTDRGGKYVDSLGAIVCALPDGRTFNVGSGFTDAQRKTWWENPSLVIGQQATVQYLMLSDDGVPLNPTFITIRTKGT